MTHQATLTEEAPTLSRRATKPVSALGWLSDPATDRGIQFAGHQGWVFWSWAELGALARDIAAGLADRGVRRLDVVGVVGSGPLFVGALFGALLAGATACPVPAPLMLENRERYRDRLRGVLGALKPAVLIAGAGLEEDVEPPAAAARVRVFPAASLLGDGGAWPGRRAPEVALVQLTSGSSGRPRPVKISLPALNANLNAIRNWLGMDERDGTVSWLPLHHDMGLVGCLMTPAANGSDVWLLSPEHFLRSPLRYLRCFSEGGATLSAMPCFGLEYIARHVHEEALDGLDLRGWRVLIVGAERLDPGSLARFHALVGAAGFDRRATLPAYGLAEATLAVTGLPPGRGWRATDAPDGTPSVVGCGYPLEGVGVEIESPGGERLGEGEVGEIVVRGASLGAGYHDPTDRDSDTALDAGLLRTGDAGFVRDGELFVLGRFGDGLKLRGRHVFAEDVEIALAAAGIRRERSAALLGHHRGVPTAVAVLEGGDGEQAVAAAQVLRRSAEGATAVVVRAPRGTIERTSSGKPRRRALWEAFVGGRIPGRVEAPDDSDRKGGGRV